MQTTERESELRADFERHGQGHILRHLGALEDMQARGVEHMSYFQVDNPMVRIADPVFLGLHASGEGSSGEMSSKMVAKRNAAEKVGVFCEVAGQTAVIEYSDMPAELTNSLDAHGKLRFNAGSIAIHAISVEFMQRLTQGDFALPFHRAKKREWVFVTANVTAWSRVEPLLQEPPIH